MRAVTDGERALLAALDAAAGEGGWCDRSVPHLADATGQHLSTVYRQLDRLRGEGRIVTEKRRILGRLRTCHRVLLPAGDDVVLLARIAALEARIAEMEGRPSAAANGEVEALLRDVRLAEVHIAALDEATVVEADEVAAVAEVGIAVRTRPLWPRGTARLPVSEMSSVALRQLLADGETRASILHTLSWYHAATLDDAEQRAWWGLHLFRPKVWARARVEAARAERRHRTRLDAALRGRRFVETAPPPRPPPDPGVADFLLMTAARLR